MNTANPRWYAGLPRPGLEAAMSVIRPWAKAIRIGLSRCGRCGRCRVGGWHGPPIRAVALLAGLATTVVLPTTIPPSAIEANIFAVPPPTGDPAADLAAIQAAVAKAKAWQASQPKGADGLAAKVEVVLAAGTYVLCPSGSATPAPPQGGGGQYCLQFINWENLVFRGTRDDTRIVLLDPDEGYIDLFQSRHITVADLTLDMETAPFTQGKVVAIHLNGVKLASLDVQLDPGFQTFADPIYQFDDSNFLVIMDPGEARPKPGVPNFIRITFTPPPYSGGTFAWGVLLPDGKTWRLTYAGAPPWSFADPSRPPIVPGDRFVFVTRRPNSGIIASLCDTVTIAHVTFHAAGGLTTGFVQNTGPLLIDDVDVSIPAGSPRLLSSDADGAHFQNNRGPITVRNSSFQGMADDVIAIYSLATTINQVIAAGANGKVVDYSPRIIHAGDRLQILDATNGAIRGIGTVTQAQTFRCPPGVTLVVCYNLTLDAVPSGTTAQDLAYLYNAAGNGASIHHNVFRAHRGNGILLFAPDSIVSDNEFTAVPNDGIIIGPFHAAFNQGPVPDHVVVRRNSFNGGDIGSDILITSVIPKAGALGGQTNAVDGPSHIVVTNNNFRNPTYPAIDVEVGDHIRLSDDRIVSDVAAAGAPAPAVRLTAGSDIAVRDLSVRAASGLSAAVEIDCGVRDIIPSRWTIRSGQVLRILDLRPQCR
ncbi:MAG TPA: hypothetical protein VKC66_11790 [Xanthobacteraceae bacterium]|nr:hypothetical protein [Xanthobacteraceae bacterium]